MSERINDPSLPTADEFRQREEARRAEGLFTLEEVAESLRVQLDWSEAQRETFLHEDLVPAVRSGELEVRRPHTLAPYRPEVLRVFYELTTPALINDWLALKGLPYHWRGLPPPAGPMGELDCSLSERVHNGEPVDWEALQKYANLTPMQAARAAYRIDPFKWPDPARYAQGPVPPDLAERIRRLEQLLRGKAAEWSLASLAGILGDEIPLGMRRALEASGSLHGPKAPASASQRPDSRRVVSSKSSRRDALDPIIDRLLAEAPGSSDHAAVWVAFFALADEKAKPVGVFGTDEGAVKYLGNDGKVKHIKRKAFMQRLKTRTASDG